MAGLTKKEQAFLDERIFREINNVLDELDIRASNREHCNYPYAIGQIQAIMACCNRRLDSDSPSLKEARNG